jgi:type VI secretion system protein ImpK
MQASAAPHSAPGLSVADGSNQGRLATALQEAFTVTVRLRTGRQVATDADAFRTQMKRLLSAADQRARAEGYSPDAVKRAIYAFVAFLDESVLSSSQPMFAGWPRQPLQEEVFGDHMAGETFFQHLREMLGRQDEAEVADVLEVYHLCLLLGFRGRFASGDRGELEALMGRIDEKILRVRGGRPPLAPGWRPLDERATRPFDPWIRWFVVAAVSMLATALVLYLVYALLLGGAVDGLEAIRDAGGTP